VYTMPRTDRALGIAAVVLTLTFLGCTDFISPFVPVVTNDLDNFEFQVSLTDVTRTTRYVWTTTGNSANVNLSSAVTAGTATVTINDADTTQVFNHALDGSGLTSTSGATAGDWTITIKLTNVSGTVHFSVQKP
jgi:hypothetical protein